MEIVEVPTPYMVEIPEELTEDCEMPRNLDHDADNVITYGDVVTYSVGLQGTVRECNSKLKQIRELQEQDEG